MEKGEIFEKVTADFKEVFEDDTPLTMQTVLRDMKIWDSMGQITFFAKLEKTFSVKFRMKDIVSFRSVENIVDGIANLLR